MSLLEVDDIHTYYDQSHILNGVSLSVAEDEVVALLGRNGAGKTTTLRSIIGLTSPRRGEIRYRGERIDTREPHEIANLGIGFVPEDRRVFTHLTVDDNIDIVTKQDSRWTRDRIYDLFPELESRASNRANKLSGGEQQMLAIARALVTDPDLLLMDEPSEGLAPVIVDKLQEMVDTLLEESGITVLFTEQNIEFAFNIAERCYILNEGSIVWGGTIEELEENEEVVKRYITLEEVSIE